MNERLWSGITEALMPQASLLTQSREFSRQAAVMVLITDELSPQLVFTRRSQQLTYHPGEVCFPGGMWEQQDSTLLASALRETQEEIGLEARHIRVLGALLPRYTGSGTSVTSFVAAIPADYSFTPNLDELDAVFTVPLAAFVEGLQIRVDTFERNHKHFQIPAYAYQGFEIWGFTAGVTTELLPLVSTLLLPTRSLKDEYI
jgi:8-oxo-dGTP pyrophosphatase MutT (NUDIX family)